MTLYLHFIQTSTDFSSSTFILYLLVALLGLVIFALGAWLRPLFARLLPSLFQEDQNPYFQPSQRPQTVTQPRQTFTQHPPPVRQKEPVKFSEPAPTQAKLDFINFEVQYNQNLVQAHQKKNFWVAASKQPLPLLREDFFVSLPFLIENPTKRNLLLGDLLKVSHHLILLGGPGSGKTEIMTYLLLTYARQATMPRFRIQETLLPVLFSATELAQELASSTELSVSALLQKQLNAPHNYVAQNLSQGGFLFLLDDLNKISLAHAERVIKWMAGIAQKHSKNRIILVARPITQNAISADSPFTIASFDRVGDHILKDLVDKWKLTIPDALNTLASIVQEEGVYPLAHTPLQLSMLLVVGLTTRTLPTHKTQLFSHYIKALLLFGEQENTPPLNLLSTNDKLSVFQHVAFTLHNERQSELDEKSLKKIVSATLAKLNVKLSGEAYAFIEFMLRSGLFTRKGNTYRFVHLTFQEFLTAQGQNIAEEGLNHLLETHKDDPWWHEVNNFYQALTDTSQAVDQAFMQETKDLPNIDNNQAYTLSLLIENLDGFTPEKDETEGGDSSSIFNFDLVNPESSSPSAESEVDEAIKIMVVDDTPQNLQLARFILQRENYTVIEASSAQEGLNLIEEDMPSLILSDIQMPGMDGYEFCRRLKAAPETQHIPFIFVTAFSRSTKEAARGLQIGADDYITRPFAPEELLARIGANVRIHQAEEAARRQATILARRNRELALLNQIQRAVTSSLNLDEVLDATMKQVQTVLKAETTSLWFVDPGNQALLLSAAYNESARTLHGIRLPLQSGIPGHIVRKRQPFLSTDIQEHPEYEKPPSDMEQILHSMIAVPLRVREKVIGILQAVHPDIDYFNQEDLHLLNAVGDAVTVAIENAWLFGQIQLFNQQLEQKVEARTHELAQEKEKTETILISIADSLLVTDPHNKIIMANGAAEELLDFELHEVMGQSIELERFNTPLWEFVRDILAQPDRTYTAQTEVTTSQTDSGLLAVQAHAAKMIDPAEETYTGNVIVLRDVTALQEVDRMKARFMTGITHELKTPIAIMTLHIGSLLKYQSLDEAKKLEMLNTIQRQASLLERLVENILELSRLDAGKHIEKSPLNLVDMSRQIAQELEPLAAQKELDFQFNPSDDVIMVDADANQLERVVRNLVDNAIKYTKEGQVSVSLDTNSDNPAHQLAVFKVSDSGIGLSAEQKSKLFERFYRADPSHNIPGTGLGLSIAQEITKKHNGIIEVESTLGQGSTFIIKLPLLGPN